MDFGLTPIQKALQEGIRACIRPFDAAYWREKDKRAEFPNEFFRAVAKAGWLGIAMPEAHGGAGLGITEAAIILHEVAASGAALSGASAVHMNIFGVHPVVKHGSEEQRGRYLPAIIQGEMQSPLLSPSQTLA